MNLSDLTPLFVWHNCALITDIDSSILWYFKHCSCDVRPVFVGDEFGLVTHMIYRMFLFQIQSSPLLWSTDARLTRLYGQFLTGLNHRSGILISNPDMKSARLNGQFSLDKTLTLQAGSTVSTSQCYSMIQIVTDSISSSIRTSLVYCFPLASPRRKTWRPPTSRHVLTSTKVRTKDWWGPRKPSKEH